jgi:hypothetical protein
MDFLIGIDRILVSFLTEEDAKTIQYDFLEGNAMVGIGMIGGDVDSIDLLVAHFFSGVDECIAGIGEAVVGGYNE